MAFDLGAMTIDPLSSAYDPRPLIPYLKELNVPYLYEEQVKFSVYFFLVKRSAKCAILLWIKPFKHSFSVYSANAYIFVV